MNLINNYELTDLTLDQQAHMYALIAWNGKNFAEAKEIVSGKTNEELEQITWANNSIETAKEGILASQEELQTDKKYTEVVKILVKIHNKWVQDNAKKYDRDAQNEDLNKVDKRLYQHLPAALIGIDELAKDMMFLQPYLEAQNIHIGAMSDEPYGAFIPTKDMEQAYQTYVDCYKQHKDITEFDASSIDRIIDDYKALKGTDEMSVARVAYMKQRTQLLAKQVQQNNPTQIKENENTF